MGKNFLFFVFNEPDFWNVQPRYYILFSDFFFFLIFYPLPWWLWDKPDVDHGNSVHRHEWIMPFKKTNLSTSRTIVPAKIALFNAKDPLI